MRGIATTRCTRPAVARTSSAHSVRLVARSGGAAVCGYPGDKVALKDYPSAGFEPMGVPANPMFERGCEISRVVPMARD